MEFYYNNFLYSLPCAFGRFNSDATTAVVAKNIITWNIWIRQIDLYGHKKVNNYVVCFYKDEILQFGLQMVRNM